MAKLKFGVEEYLTELETDKAIANVNIIENDSPDKTGAIADINSQEKQANEEKSTDDTNGTNDGEQADPDNRDQEAKSDESTTVENDTVGGTETGGGSVEKSVSDTPATESIFIKWKKK